MADIPRGTAAWLFFLICLVGGVAVYGVAEVHGITHVDPDKIEQMAHNIAVICTTLGAPCVF